MNRFIALSVAPIVWVAVACLTAACGSSPAPADPAGSADTPAAPPASSLPVQSVVAGRVPLVGPQPAIVVLRPRNGPELPPQSSKPVMDQVALTFIPGLLIVRTGAPAEFRNSDDVLHNVRVSEEATKDGTFNVAIPMGENYEHTFARDGFYNVGCDIHPAMTATIYSSPSPYTAVSDPAGRFEMYDVPPGPYTAVIFSGADRMEQPVDVIAGRTELTLSR
jgi:plastocyanin